MSLGALALIGVCGLVGPLLSGATRGLVPVVVGEIVAGVVAGRTGLRLLHTGDPTTALLSDVGFVLLMFGVGMNLPLRDSRLRTTLDRGGLAAVIAAGWRWAPAPCCRGSPERDTRLCTR